MLEVDNYKMFEGIMNIVPVSLEIQSYFVTGTWLYKPETKRWYCSNGFNYPASVCYIHRDFENRSSFIESSIDAMKAR